MALATGLGIQGRDPRIERRQSTSSGRRFLIPTFRPLRSLPMEHPSDPARRPPTGQARSDCIGSPCSSKITAVSASVLLACCNSHWHEDIFSTHHDTNLSG